MARPRQRIVEVSKSPTRKNSTEGIRRSRNDCTIIVYAQAFRAWTWTEGVRSRLSRQDFFTTTTTTTIDAESHLSHPFGTMVKRRSKRKATVLESLGGIRRSARKRALKVADHKVYGEDYGILPSD